MTLSFAIGLLAGSASVVIILAIARKKGKYGEYDERQAAVRGKAYKAGFFCFVLCEAVVFLIEIITQKPLVIVENGVLNWLIVLFSCLVFVEFAVFNDAYFTPDKPFSKRWAICTYLYVVLSLIQSFRVDEPWFKVITLSAGIFVFVIITSVIIRRMIAKKTEKEEDDE